MASYVKSRTAWLLSPPAWFGGAAQAEAGPGWCVGGPSGLERLWLNIVHWVSI